MGEATHVTSLLQRHKQEGPSSEETLSLRGGASPGDEQQHFFLVFLLFYASVFALFP